MPAQRRPPAPVRGLCSRSPGLQPRAGRCSGGCTAGQQPRRLPPPGRVMLGRTRKGDAPPRRPRGWASAYPGAGLGVARAQFPPPPSRGDKSPRYVYEALRADAPTGASSPTHAGTTPHPSPRQGGFVYVARGFSPGQGDDPGNSGAMTPGLPTPSRCGQGQAHGQVSATG